MRLSNWTRVVFEWLAWVTSKALSRPTIGLRRELQIKRHYHTADSIRRGLAVYESHFGLDSRAFYERYKNDALPCAVPRSDANSWAGLIEEYESLSSGEAEADLAGRVEKVLTLG